MCVSQSAAHGCEETAFTGFSRVVGHIGDGHGFVARKLAAHYPSYLANSHSFSFFGGFRHWYSVNTIPAARIYDYNPPAISFHIT